MILLCVKISAPLRKKLGVKGVQGKKNTAYYYIFMTICFGKKEVA